MSQFDLPITIPPKVWAHRIVTIHLPSAEDQDVTLCGHGATRDDPTSDNPDDCGCLDCLLIWERRNKRCFNRR